MKKYIIGFAILLLTISNSVQASSTDDISGHYFENEMRSLQALGIMYGDGNGNFSPNKKVTRAQFAAFLNRSLHLPSTESKPFNDITKHVLASEINNAAAVGYINGVGGGKFLPDRAMTREEVAIMVGRVLTSKGLKAGQEPITFSDANQITYPSAIQPIISYKIMGGYPDHTFRPHEGISRAQTAAVIYKMYNLLETVAQETEDEEEKDPDPPNDSTNDQENESENNANEDNQNASNQSGSDVDNQENSSLLVIATKLINVYEAGMKRVRTYVNAGTEMKFLKDNGDAVEVEVAGVNGFVKKAEVEIIPEDEVTTRSYYKAVAQNLRHYVSQNGQYESYIFGPVPSFLKEGEKDYSFDGKTFTGGTYYQYFDYLPLLSETTYSGEELDKYIESQNPNSPLIGLGDVFKRAEEETGVNALYLLAHAIHESAWGLSKLATEKYNLFGIRAIDVDAYNTATEFASFEECIMYAARYIKDNYLTPGDRSFYNGSFLGHKGVGVNLFYASDPYWGQKIAGRMYSADLYLGGDDWNKYDLAISKVPSLNVRSGPSTKDKLLYEHRYAGVTMIVLDEIKESDGTWYKIKSDDPDYEEGYIYAYGKKGEFAEVIN